MSETEGQSSFDPEGGESSEPEAETRYSVENFLEQYGQSVGRYGRDTSLKVEVINPQQAGKGQPESWAIDLEGGTIYADPKFFLERGYELADTQFALFHEVEHFRELRDLLNEPDGYQIWQRHRQKTADKQRLHLLDNCLDDIRMNRTVISRAPALDAARTHLYQDKLFPESNFQTLPKHLQFAYACLRERMLPSEPCVINEDVRQELNRLSGLKDRSGRTLLEVMTDPKLPSSQRLKLQEQFFEPVYEKFFQDDVAKQRETSKGGQNGEGDDGSEDGDQAEGAADNTAKPSSSPSAGSPESFFKQHYEDFFANSPDAVIDQKAVDQIMENYAKDHGLDLPEGSRAEAAYARSEGVTVEDLRTYRSLWEKVAELRNSETNETVIDELRAIFRQIIAERTRPRDVPYAPQTEGEVLINPVQAYTDVLAGKEESEAWLTHRTEQQIAEKTGAFDVTLICDRSSSMDNGSKSRDQLLSAILLMEALEEFSNELDEAKLDLLDALSVRTEIRSFGAGSKNHDVLKPLDGELTERQRVAVAKALTELPGSTPDFLPLEAIDQSLGEKEIEEIQSGVRRKIVIALSDGDSDNAARTQKALEQLRQKGVTIAALGIGSSARSITATYAPNGQVVPNPEQLGVVLGQLLEQFLSKL